MGRNNKVWIITLLAFFMLLLIVLYIREVYLIRLLLALLFLLPLYFLLDDLDKNAGKSRSVVAILSIIIPGAAHLYLRQYRRSTLFLAGYVLALGNILLLTMFLSESDVYLIFASFAATLAGMYSLSMVDAEKICNRLNMPYTGDPYEIRVKNYPLAYVTSVLAPFVFVLLVLAGIILSGAEASTDLVLLIIGSWAAALVICVIRSIIIGDRNALDDQRNNRGGPSGKNSG